MPNNVIIPFGITNCPLLYKRCTETCNSDPADVIDQSSKCKVGLTVLLQATVHHQHSRLWLLQTSLQKCPGPCCKPHYSQICTLSRNILMRLLCIYIVPYFVCKSMHKNILLWVSACKYHSWHLNFTLFYRNCDKLWCIRLLYNVLRKVKFYKHLFLSANSMLYNVFNLLWYTTTLVMTCCEQFSCHNV